MVGRTGRRLDHQVTQDRLAILDSPGCIPGLAHPLYPQHDRLKSIFGDAMREGVVWVCVTVA